MDSQIFLDERQLAGTIGCSVPAIRHWRRGGLPHYRFGRLVRFRLDEVLAWFAERQGASEKEPTHEQPDQEG